MECLQARQLISEALDRAPVDAAALAEAKQHCRDCAECNAFVRALATVQRTPAPAPPADLADRVIARVRAEHAASTAAAASAAAAGENAIEARPARTTDERPTAPGSVPDAATTGTPSSPSEAIRRLGSRRTLLAWGSAAAAVFIIAGIASVRGARTILIPEQSAEKAVTADVGAVVQGYGSTGASQTPATAAVPGMAAPGQATMTGDYLELNGAAYRSTGPDTEVDAARLDPVGQTTTAVGGTTPVTREVLADRNDPTRVYLVTDDETVIGFTLVTRDYEGRTYVLQTSPIAGAGQYPTLPAGIETPTQADGSPVFKQDGTDAGGTVVYVKRAGSARDGIAIAPGTPTIDPAAGNPGWTWWVPQR